MANMLTKNNSCRSFLKGLYEKKVNPEESFHFYEGIGKPINHSAFSLKEFKDKIERVSLTSIRFHQERGDFATWVRNALGNIGLADAIERVEKTGEDLRSKLLNVLNEAEKALCPECVARVEPTKVWRMAGRPSKKGKRLQLTIGFYRCPVCNKVFRQVILKQKIRVT